MRSRRCVLISAAFLAVSAVGAAAGADPLDDAVAAPQRTPRFVARDFARHPLEQLRFFGLTRSSSVVEIWPGGGYWTEILAPFLAADGTYYVAISAGGNAAAQKEAADEQMLVEGKMAADPGRFGHIRMTSFGGGAADIAPPGSADIVLTFRNLHNWMGRGEADAAFATFFRALKPGGVLGIEEHRGRPDRPQDPTAKSGYVRQDYTIALAERAGFVFEAASEVNANPKDTTDWPAGVWTLPPTFRLGDVDRAKYAAIGEADNFVLRFRKPAQ